MNTKKNAPYTLHSSRATKEPVGNRDDKPTMRTTLLYPPLNFLCQLYHFLCLMFSVLEILSSIFFIVLTVPLVLLKTWLIDFVHLPIFSVGIRHLPIFSVGTRHLSDQRPRDQASVGNHCGFRW